MGDASGGFMFSVTHADEDFPRGTFCEDFLTTHYKSNTEQHHQLPYTNEIITNYSLYFLSTETHSYHLEFFYDEH